MEWGEEVPIEKCPDKDKMFYKSCDLNSMFKKLWTEATNFCSQLTLDKDLKIASNRAFVIPNLDNFPYGFFSQKKIKETAAKAQLDNCLKMLPTKTIREDLEAR